MNDNFYKEIIEELPLGYAYHKILCDENSIPNDYEFLEANPAFEKYTGFRIKEIIGKKLSDIIPNSREDEFDWIKFYGEVALNGGEREFETYNSILKKWFKIKVWSPEKYYFITYFKDITEETQKYGEYKMLLEALNDAVFELNEDYVFETVITPDDGVLFIPRNAIIGKNITELFPEDMANLFIDTFVKAVLSKQKESVIYQAPNPEIQKWYKADIKYIQMYDRKKFIVNVSDITEAKKYEEALLEKTTELDRFFSVNLDLLCIADIEGYFRKVNKSWESILGYTQEYLQGKKFLDFIHPDDLDSTMDAISKLKEQEEVLNFVNRYRCMDGTYKYIEWRSHPYGDLIYAAARDITQRKLMEDTLFIQKERYQTTLLSIGDGVISLNKNENVVFMNPVAEQLTGWCKKDAAGKPFEEIFNIVHEITREKAENPVTKVLETGNIVELANHTALIRKDGQEIPIEDSAAPIKNKYGELQGVVLVFRDITEKKKIRNQIEYLSFHDFLTGLYNRRFFEEELVRLDIARNLPLSVIMIDVNGLKLTNDAFGHGMGDALLKRVAEIIKQECRPDDIIARIGGDEFAIILPKTDSIQAEIIKNRIMESASKNTLESIVISVAVGCDTKTGANQDTNEVLKGSEHKMYRDKIKSSRSMRNKTLNLIIETLNNKYEQEQVHMERVGQICRQIGIALGLPQDDVKTLEIAGFLHDIGKIMVPYEIINKEQKLTEEEFELIKRHSETGYQILKSVENYSGIAEYILCHHERWDGKGYPRKLKGEEIPLFSRIIFVADAYEAITAGRIYKLALEKEAAMAEMQKNAGTQFDPEILKVFIEKVLNVYDF